MSRHDDQRIADVLAAMDAHLERGTLHDGLIFDAVRMRLLEIGEAVKDISPELLATESDIPWDDIAGMRDRLAHRYFDTSHAIVAGTVTQDLPDLRAAALRLRGRAES